MAIGTASFWLAEKIDERVPGLLSAGIRTRLVIPACTIQLTRCDAGKPYTRAFLARYRAVTIPNPYGRANELLTCWYDRYLRRKN